MSLSRSHVRQYRDHTFSAKRQNRNDLVIITGINITAVTTELCHFGDLGNISTCFFHRYNVLYMFCQISNRLRRHIYTGTSLNIIKDDRNLYRIGNGCKMCDQTFLGCFIIIRRYQQQTICAVFFRFLRQIDRGLSTIRTSTCDHRDSSSYFLNRKTDGFQMLLMSQRGRLTSSSTDDDRICSILDLIIQKFFQLRIIHLAICFHRCYNCYSCTCKNRHIFSSCYFLF